MNKIPINVYRYRALFIAIMMMIIALFAVAKTLQSDHSWSVSPNPWGLSCIALSRDDQCQHSIEHDHLAALIRG